MKRRRGFSFVEIMLVVGLLGLFASLVIPGLASARLPIETPVEHALEADLRQARTEAIARAAGGRRAGPQRLGMVDRVGDESG